MFKKIIIEDISEMEFKVGDLVQISAVDDMFNGRNGVINNSDKNLYCISFCGENFWFQEFELTHYHGEKPHD